MVSGIIVLVLGSMLLGAILFLASNGEYNSVYNVPTLFSVALFLVGLVLVILGSTTPRMKRTAPPPS